MATVRYNKNLKLLARQMRNNSTPAEIALWMKLRQNQFMGYDFHRQKPIGNFIADLYCYNLRLVIEVDGQGHYTDEDTMRRDNMKDEYLKSIGFVVIRFTNDEVLTKMNNVLHQLEQFAVAFEQREKNENT
ncbi:endonuclease domain-containing protein [soil metagenome]